MPDLKNRPAESADPVVTLSVVEGPGRQGAQRTFPERDLVDGDRIKLGNTVLQVGIRVPAPLTMRGTLTPHVCSVCGRPLAGDSQHTAGAAVCANCQCDRGAAIEALLRRLVAGQVELPEIEGYELVQELGDGGQGVVYLAHSGGDVVGKVADFGLSKAFGKAGLSGMTMTGTIAGTVPFMARPQVVSFKYAKPEVDVRSIAAMLYWMLTGCYPRDFPEHEDPIRVVLDTEAIKIRKRNPNIPERLADVIDEALIDKPKDTITSAAELAGALREAL